jgi:hypothetical protein
MKKTVAVICIAICSLALIGIPRSVQQNPLPPGDYAGLVGRLAAVVTIIGFLFFSVRWYITLSGHTYRVSRQAWASILFWYSFVGILMGATFVRLAVITGHSSSFGMILAAVWALIAFACWEWRKRLRAQERKMPELRPVGHGS